MSYQQNQQQCQPPPKCQTPKYPPKNIPQATYTPPVSYGCVSSSGGCDSSGGFGSYGGCGTSGGFSSSGGCGNSVGCGSSGGCSSLGGLGGLGGLGSGCSLFSHHRSNRCRGQNPGPCDSGSGYNQQSGGCGGSYGGC